MIPELGQEGSAALACRLIELSVRNAFDHWPGEVTLYVWPNTDHEFLHDLSNRYGLTISRQSLGDLGQKMFNALQEQALSGTPAVIMGCDVPHCPKQILQQAYDEISQGHHVIGSSDDGGYYLIGINPPNIDVFSDIPWGSDRVFSLTIEKAAENQIEFTYLPQLNDLDTLEDVLALPIDQRQLLC